MIEEKVLIQNFISKKKKERLKKPDWLRIRVGDPTNQNAVLKLIEGLNLHTVCQARPNVLNHNTETIARLYRRVRPDAKYVQTLELLERAARFRDTQFPQMKTKSGIMAGLGETFEEVVELMKDLRSVSCDIMTIGQYLQPHARRLPVERYVIPAEFDHWRDIGLKMGFRHVQSSPLTRSSYHARELAAPAN